MIPALLNAEWGYVFNNYYKNRREFHNCRLLTKKTF